MERVKAKERLVEFLKAFLISAIAAALIMLLLPPHWETDDDWIMANMAAGVYGRAESYIPFIHPFLGIILKKAYELVPALPWMGILWEATVFVSFTGMLWAFQSALGAKKGTLLWGTLFIMFAPSFYVTVNFTRVAAIAAGAGYLMMFSGLRKKDYLPVVLGIGICWMGCAIRLESWQMITVLAGGVGLAELFWKQGKMSLEKITKIVLNNKHYFLVFGILFLGCLAIDQTERLYNNANPQIAEYEDYNSARAGLLDFPMAEYVDIKDGLEEIGISAENYSALKYDFITSDPEIFDKETFLDLQELQEITRLNPLGAAVTTLKLLATNQCVISLAGCFLVIWISKGRKCFFLFLWLAGSYGIMNYYLVITGRNPARVIESLSAIVAAYLFWKIDEQRNQVTLKSATVLLSMALLLNSSVYFFPELPNADVEEQILTETLEELNQTGRYYLCGQTDLGIETYDLGMEGIENLSANSRQHFLYTGGWWINSPSYMNQLEQAGIMNPYRDILRYDNLLLIDQYKTGLVFSYIRSNYDHPWFPENWSVCDKIMEGLYVIGFNKDITADGPSNDIEWVQAAQIAGSERDLIWFKVLFDGNESLKEKENIYYVQITDREGNTKTYRGEAKQTDAGLELMVGIPREAVTDDTVQLALLRKNLEGRYEETSSVPVEIKNLW